jgi:hypothetical protein
MPLSPEKRSKLERFAKLKPVAPRSPKGSPSNAALGRSLASLGRALQTADEAASIRFRLLAAGGAGRELAQTLVLAPGRAGVVAALPGPPTLEVAMSRDDWWAIARGEASPAAVFLMGRMGLRGDCQLARRLYRRLAGKGIADVRA